MTEIDPQSRGTVLSFNRGTPQSSRRTAVMQNGARQWEIWYRSEHGPLADDIDCVLPAMLLTAMTLREPLTVSYPVSATLFRSLPRIQDIVHCWWPELARIKVQATARPSSGPQGHGVGTMFTGGVDSFYTLLKHRQEISHLIFVHGFDVPLENEDLRRRVSKQVHSVAAALGKQVIEIETNFRQMSDQFVSWMSYFGSALASIALLLAPRLKRVYIPSSNTYAQLYPVGAHPLLDPLWSTEEVEIVHDGCEASRMEKVAALSQSDVALRSLRVCWENRGGAYNCGQCEKCLRTMVSLRIAGALGRCRTFHDSLDLSTIASLEIPNEHVRGLWEDSFRWLRAKGGDLELEQAMRRCLDESRSGGRRVMLHRALDRFLDGLQALIAGRSAVDNRGLTAAGRSGSERQG